MRRNNVLAVLVALFAILFFAVVPSVSASAATGSTPSPTTPACSPSDCTLPPALPLTSKDHPSKDVVPPAGTVPLSVDVPLNGDTCNPTAPCTQSGDFADLPTTDSQTVTITIDEYNSLINEIRDMKFRGLLTAIGVFAASVIVLVLLLIGRSIERRHDREIESKPVTPGYKLN